MRDDSDSELLRLFAGGKSDDAFAELVQRHIGAVYAVTLRRVGGDAHLANDVTQEVFTDLARKAGSLARKESLVGWLFVAARFASANAVRRDQQRQRLWEKAHQMSEYETQGRPEPDWEQLRPVLDDAIHKLNERDRTAVLLHFFERRTYGELATKLGVTENGARMRVERAVGKLRRSLGYRGVTSTAAALCVALGGQAVAAVPANLAATVTAAATTAAAQSGGALILFLMAITKTQLGVAIATIVTGATIIGVSQHREIAMLQLETQARSSELKDSSRRAAELAEKLRAAEIALADVRGKLAELKTASGSAAVSAPDNSNQGVKIVHIQDILRNHPEYEALQRKERRRWIVRRYGSAITALRLPTDQAEKLKELLVENEMSSLDAAEAAREAGLRETSSPFNQAQKEATNDIKRAITSLIGNDAYEKLEALKGINFGSQNAVDDYVLDMADNGNAISPEQSQYLAQTLHRLTSATRNSPPGYRELDPTTHLSPLDQEFLSLAATELTPAQVRVLKTSRSEDNQREAILKPYHDAAPGLAIMITN